MATTCVYCAAFGQGEADRTPQKTVQKNTSDLEGGPPPPLAAAWPALMLAFLPVRRIPGSELVMVVHSYHLPGCCSQAWGMRYTAEAAAFHTVGD